MKVLRGDTIAERAMYYAGIFMDINLRDGTIVEKLYQALDVLLPPDWRRLVSVQEARAGVEVTAYGDHAIKGVRLNPGGLTVLKERVFAAGLQLTTGILPTGEVKQTTEKFDRARDELVGPVTPVILTEQAYQREHRRVTKVAAAVFPLVRPDTSPLAKPPIDLFKIRWG